MKYEEKELRNRRLFAFFSLITALLFALVSGIRDYYISLYMFIFASLIFLFIIIGCTRKLKNVRKNNEIYN